MAYVSVSIAHRDDWRNYKAAGFTFGFRASSGTVQNWDGQNVKVVHENNGVMFTRGFTGYLQPNNFDGAGDATYSTFAPQGQRHTITARITTWDNKGDGQFYATAVATGYSFYTPRISLSMFAPKGTGSTTASVVCTNMDTPQNERLSYQNWNLDGYRQTTPGTKNTTVTYTGLQINPRKQLAFGMIEANADNGYLGNGEERQVLPWVYPAYTALSKGSVTAARNTTTPSTVRVNWGAWGGFGNMTGWAATIQILDSSNNAIIKSQAINATVASSADVTGLPLDKSLNVRIMLTGKYHDGTTKTEYSATVALGYLNNTFYKVDGVWRRGIRTYYKVGGVWRANNGLVRHKTGGAWK